MSIDGRGLDFSLCLFHLTVRLAGPRCRGLLTRCRRMPTIGDYSLYTIETGRFGLDGGAMFGIIPKPLWEKKIPPDGRNRIPLNMRCLLLEGPDRLILIDNGIGDKFDEKRRDIYAIDHDYANLHGSLEEAGFAAAEVTDVILTHLHFDHCGGSTRYRKSGELTLTFPNAHYYVQRAHWEWARTSNPKEAGSFLDEDLEPLAASGQLKFTEGEEELLPGIEVMTVDGHTERQQLVKISDEDTTLVFVADLLPTTAHLKPVWVMAYDVHPLTTIEEKGAFLERAVEEGWHLFFEHDPEVAVASLRRDNGSVTTTDPRPLSAL